ncbi:Pkinase-domain-containing protein [Suhomyces tanzawaensis NRRL Y-17324]|uniref:non-specific serine/threonine protein kinase n=1 Tax=Suhomyces tanzawaensis NRRL Y-17324 TaxID=984487 RepID=A0A1E4SJX4_9ASCO|nr:Pkinase-domain-containing protein [Suhomyces tanzawaensis NRRL Y-17324]ODV79804.1 Pkinase-domain-containing protein [Suhomyces tanzawaensis NRRL Y-17324]
MNGTSRLISDQNYKAQLAAQFNDFYLQITSPNVSQIGNYRIVREIGEGAFGKVYLATHVLLNVKVVLKCGLVDDPNIVREIYYHRQLKHKNIVNLYEVIKTENHLWIVLEYCEGSELFFLIYEKKRLEIKECQHLFFQIVLALKYVHSLNLSHRDLKLENILLSDKRKTLVKLTDFGFVREFNPQNRKFLSTICGTTVYMAPELLKSDKYSGFAIDIWSLGVILFTMVYGEMPFDEDDDLKTKYKIINEEPRYRDSISVDLKELIASMLNKDPTKRPNATQILNSLFLIDLYNKHLDKTSRHTSNDAESVISINQHYRVNTSPFQTKIEKDLVKRMKKLNFNTDELQLNVLNNQMNSLTAFYELSLTREFCRKKKKYYRQKSRGYFEAKRTLNRSRSRVKSVLSLTDLSHSPQPIEKIKSSLSVSSLKNHSKTNLKGLGDSIEQKRIDSQLSRNSYPNSLLREQLKDQSILTNVPSAPPSPRTNSYIPPSPGSKTQMNTPESRRNYVSRTSVDGTPLERIVSFYPESSNIQRVMNTPQKSTETLEKKSKNAKFFNKLKFWKRNKKNNDDNASLISHSRTFTSTESEVLPAVSRDYRKSIEENDGPLEIVAKRSNPSPEHNDIHLQQSVTIIPNGELEAKKMDDTRRSLSFEDRNGRFNEEKPRSPANEQSILRSTRARPSSMVSQISQISQISQMSTMLSESEIDNMDETDTMEEDYDDDDDGMYEGSLNVSQDFGKPSSNTGTQSKPSVFKKRPSYRRTTSSEQSIKSTSTTATNYKHQKKFSLSQLSSNSSEESSIKSNNVFGMPIPTKPTKPTQPDLDSALSQVQNARSSSPELIKKEKRWNNSSLGVQSKNSSNPSSGTAMNGNYSGSLLATSTLGGPYKSDTPFFRSHSPPVPKKFNKINNKIIKPVKTALENSAASVKPNTSWNKATQTADNSKKGYAPVIDEEEESE